VVTIVRDQPQDQVGLAWVTALEPLRSLHLSDPQSQHDADEHEHREHVHEQCEPSLVARVHVLASNACR